MVVSPFLATNKRMGMNKSWDDSALRWDNKKKKNILENGLRSKPYLTICRIRHVGLIDHCCLCFVCTWASKQKGWLSWPTRLSESRRSQPDFVQRWGIPTPLFSLRKWSSYNILKSIRYIIYTILFIEKIIKSSPYTVYNDHHIYHTCYLRRYSKYLICKHTRLMGYRDACPCHRWDRQKRCTLKAATRRCQWHLYKARNPFGAQGAKEIPSFGHSEFSDWGV